MQTLKSLKAAEAITQKAQAARELLLREQETLAGLLTRQTEVEGKLAALEVGGGEGKALKNTEAEFDGARSAVQGAGRRVAKLRVNFASLAEALSEAHQVLRGELPGHIQALAEQVRSDWQRASEPIAQLLGRQQNFEQLTGEPLPLESPEPVIIQEPSGIAAPWVTLASIETHLQGIAALQPTPDKAIESGRPYILTRDVDDLPPGTLVSEGTFGLARLNELLRADYVRPVEDPALAASAQTAHNALQAITTWKRDTEAKATQRRRAQHDEDAELENGKHMFPDIHGRAARLKKLREWFAQRDLSPAQLLERDKEMVANRQPVPARMYPDISDENERGRKLVYRAGDELHPDSQHGTPSEWMNRPLP